MMTESKTKKPATPFHERSLLEQENAIRRQTESRLLKLPSTESMQRVLSDLTRSVEHEVNRRAAATRKLMPTALPGDTLVPRENSASEADL